MSTRVATLLVALVAVIHVGIAVAEMLFWNASIVHGRLDYTIEEARRVAPIVANAGLYNSFLAAGLIWALVSYTPGSNVTIFFLICVIVAGLFGAVTLKPTTLVLQTIPAAAALGAVWMTRAKALPAERGSHR
jgi:putative membrane protein